MKDQFNLLRRIEQGDKSAFRLLYDLNVEKVMNTAISYVKNFEEAEEITQDVFTKVYTNADKFKGQSKVSTWIYRITINTSLNYLKKKKSISRSAIDIDNIVIPELNHPGILLENKEESDTLFTAISQLSENQKSAFILSFVEGLPRQEVADIMETSLKAIESLLQRGKAKLRELLAQEFDNRRNYKKK